MNIRTTDWPLPQINQARCTGCGVCVQQCPKAAMEVRDGHAVVARPWDCTFCEVCENYCPTGAIGRPFTIIFESNEFNTASC